MSLDTSNFQSPSVYILPDGRMDTQNAAIYCGLTTKTLAMKRSNGTGPKYRKLGRVFYYRKDLDAWLESDRVCSTAQARTLSPVPVA